MLQQTKIHGQISAWYTCLLLVNSDNFCLEAVRYDLLCVFIGQTFPTPCLARRYHQFSSSWFLSQSVLSLVFYKLVCFWEKVMLLESLWHRHCHRCHHNYLILAITVSSPDISLYLKCELILRESMITSKYKFWPINDKLFFKNTI